MIAGLRLTFSAFIVILMTAILAPVQIAASAFGNPLARKLPLFWHRVALRLIGLRVHVRGEIPRERPLLIVANHVSWSDIMVLGSVMELCFIAKSEVRRWPGINLLAWLQRTVFIDRERRSDTRNQTETIAARLIEGDAMVLFAEGTTSDGHLVLPFKSALFGAVHAALAQAGLDSVKVQPVAIAYTRLHGLPLGRLHQSRAAWPGDIALGPHLLAFLLAGAYDVDVVFGKAERFSADVGRKQIAARMHREIRQDFAEAMRMRGSPSV